MSADSSRVKDLFLAAAARPPADRPGFLAAACGPDGDLRAAVDRLLSAHDHPDSLLDPTGPVGPVRDSYLHRLAAFPLTLDNPNPAAGTVVDGRYKLIEPIGEGGMGEVWVAQQTEPVRRVVAVKLIKPGMDSRTVLARFEAERQALALMDHPNIARVLDAGTTAGGRPFFVMELVKGVPITRFCDERKLTPRERLELFVPVCWAIQHAHQKGIIHRDLKPSNVLVALYDDRPVPKVIDFGVAKAAGQPLTDRTLMTGFGSVIGTPEYMSPEQATFNALDVDTRTDVYALGVLMYELLTGATPLGRAGSEAGGLLEVLRIVREQDPPRPSNKLSTAVTLPVIAANRGTEPRKLARLVRGELDWIVMRALDKDRARRYDTASGLAQDVERYLAGEPVRAVPPSAGYRVRKFVRRNRGPVAAAGLVLLALVGGVVGTTVGLVRAEIALGEADAARAAAVAESERAGTAEHVAAARLAEATAARARVEEQRDAAAQAAGFVYYDILGQADIRRQALWRDVLDPDLTIRDTLDQVATKIDEMTRLTRRTEATLRWAVGDAYVGCAQPDKAIRQYERARDLLAADPDYGPGHAETIFGMHKLAVAYRAVGRPGVALPLSKSALDLSLAHHARYPADMQGPLVAMNDVGLGHQALGQTAEAVRQFDAAVEWATAKFGPVHDETDGVRFNLAEACRAAGGFDRAAALHRQVLARAATGPDDLWTAECRTALAQTLMDAGTTDGPEELLRAALATRRRRGPTVWTTFHTASLLGQALARAGKPGEAEGLLAEGYREMKAREARIVPQHKYLLGDAAGRLADLHAARGDAAGAAKWRAERAKFPPPAPAPRPAP